MSQNKGFWAPSALARVVDQAVSVVKEVKSSQGLVTIATLKAPYNGTAMVRILCQGRESSQPNFLANPNGWYVFEWVLRIVGYGDGTYLSQTSIFNGSFGGPNNGTTPPTINPDGTYSITQNVSGFNPAYNVKFQYQIESRSVNI